MPTSRSMISRGTHELWPIIVQPLQGRLFTRERICTSRLENGWSPTTARRKDERIYLSEQVHAKSIFLLLKVE